MIKRISCLFTVCCILFTFFYSNPLSVLADEAQAYSVTEYHASAYISSSKRLNVRSGPSTDYQVLHTLSSGTEITIIGKTDNNWYQIQLEDEIGFVSAKYVSDPVEIVEEKSEEDNKNHLFDLPGITLPNLSMVDSSFLTVLIVAIIVVLIFMFITLSQVISLTRDISKSRSYYSRQYEDEEY